MYGQQYIWDKQRNEVLTVQASSDGYLLAQFNLATIRLKHLGLLQASCMGLLRGAQSGTMIVAGRIYGDVVACIACCTAKSFSS